MIKYYVIKFKGTVMKASYKKLWKLLIDRDMKKKDLRDAAQLSPSSMAKLAKNENVSMNVLVRVCTALNVDISDIMEMLPEENTNSEPDIK